MDQESIAFFEERFREISREISSFREETTQQISSLREETTQQIASLREETTQQISSLREETVRRFEQVDHRLDKQDETARHTLILVEGLRGDVQLMGEGVMGFGEQLERYHSQATVSFQQVDNWIRPPFEELRRHCEDLDRKHGELDSQYDGLDRRVRSLEERADRQQGDVVEAIRKRFGKQA